MAIGIEVSPSAGIRSRLDHPVIDVDAHTTEYLPAFLAYLDDEGGPRLVDRLRSQFAAGIGPTETAWYELSGEERFRRRSVRPSWWVATTNTRDLAASATPAIFYDRMEEFGLDYSVVFPGVGNVLPFIEDEELRRLSCRAINTFYAEEFRGLSDRLTPVAVIPMHTPEEALAELEHAVRELGHKVITPAGYVWRSTSEGGSQGNNKWVDTFALDSLYDYDPVWAACVELRVCPMFHSHSMGWSGRSSISSYMYNQIGHFADAGEALCKSLFFGGVTHRFPAFRAGFMEGGVAWGARLYTDLVSRWKKRGAPFIGRLDPAGIDRSKFEALIAESGGDALRRRTPNQASVERLTARVETDLDEFANCDIQSVQDIRDLFIPHFAFGCEADDPLTSTAFNPGLPLGAKVTAIFGSDIGHWDVADARDVLAEAHELREEGVLTSEQFREFLFLNPVRFLGGLNPDFFAGTVIEGQVAELGL